MKQLKKEKTLIGILFVAGILVLTIVVGTVETTNKITLWTFIGLLIGYGLMGAGVYFANKK